MYANILVSIDLAHGDGDAPALATAAEYARAFGARLNLVTVVPDFGMSIVGGFFPADFERQALGAARVALHEYSERHLPPGTEVRHIVGHGTPYREILRYAGEIAADLIVMASHRPTASDYLLGPNAARVVRHADTSVLVVRPGPARP
jgi:nucleotide-binding universal stress UspA family protein